MAKNPGAKGSQFERDMCRRLTKWMTGEEKPEVVWRSSTSGAKATMEHKAGRRSHMGGDIVAIHPKGQWLTEMFSLEFKNRKSFGSLPLLFLNRAAVLDWWDQCVSDAKAQGKIPWMIFKENRSKIYTISPAKFIPLQPPQANKFLTIHAPNREPFMVMLLEDLLNTNSSLPNRAGTMGRPKKNNKPQRI